MPKIHIAAKRRSDPLMQELIKVIETYDQSNFERLQLSRVINQENLSKIGNHLSNLPCKNSIVRLQYR